MNTKRKQRKQHNPHFKFNVALAAVREDKSLNQLSDEFGVHPTQISQWKHHLLNNGTMVFDKVKSSAQDSEKAKLYERIGRLNIELEGHKASIAQPARRASVR